MPVSRAVFSVCLMSLAASGGCASSTTPIDAPTPGNDAFARGFEILGWSQTEKVSRFARMDALFPSQPVRRGTITRELAAGTPLPGLTPGSDAERQLNEFMTSQQVAGLLVLQDGRVRLERYGLGLSAAATWTSFSVAKSVTSLLVGAAIRDGFIAGLDAPITDYIRDLRGSAYEGVTVRHLLTMTSGVAWNESYTDPNSDVARLSRFTPEPGVDANVSYAKTLRRASPPGTRWVYKTLETNLLGTLVIEATRRPLATYLSEKIWAPYGMERDASWLVDHIAHAQGGCCLQATVRDFGRIGQFVLDGGRVNGTSILPAGWIAASTQTLNEIGVPGRGYGYQWWTVDDGSFEGQGIFGQLIHIDPARRLVVVIVGAWAAPNASESFLLQRQLVASIKLAVDAP